MIYYYQPKLLFVLTPFRKREPIATKFDPHKLSCN